MRVLANYTLSLRYLGCELIVAMVIKSCKAIGSEAETLPLYFIIYVGLSAETNQLDLHFPCLKISRPICYDR